MKKKLHDVYNAFTRNLHYNENVDPTYAIYWNNYCLCLDCYQQSYASLIVITILHTNQKYIIYCILSPYLGRISIMLHSPLHPFKGLTSPFLDVFNTIKEKNVMEHVDIYTSAGVENVTWKKFASKIAPDKVIQTTTQIPQATTVTHTHVTVQGQSHKIPLHAQHLLNPSPNSPSIWTLCHSI